MGLEDTVAAAWPVRHAWRNAPFDCVTMIHVIEHLLDPRGSLEAAAEVLRPGGLVLVETPNIWSWPARLFGRDWVTLDAPRHLCLFNASALASCLRQAGFEPLLVTTVSPSTMEYSESLRYFLRHRLLRREPVAAAGEGAPPAPGPRPGGDAESAPAARRLLHRLETMVYRAFNRAAGSMGQGCNLLAVAARRT